MTNGEDDLKVLVSYLGDRIVATGNQGRMEVFVDALIDFSDVVQDYLSQRANLDSTVDSGYASSVERLFAQTLTNIYGELQDASPEHRREVLGTAFTITTRAQKSGLTSAYSRFLSAVTHCYNVEIQTRDPPTQIKQHLVTRTQILLSQVIDDIQASDSAMELDQAESFWSTTIQELRDLLKIAVEAQDLDTYDAFITDLIDLSRFDVIAMRDQEREADTNEVVRERKEQLAATIDRVGEVSAFVLTGWAFRLHRTTALTRSEYVDIASITESERSEIEDVAELYFTDVRGLHGDKRGFWERWQLQEATSDQIGAVMTSPAALSWLFEFYCVELLRVAADEELQSDPNLDEPYSPVPAVQSVLNTADKVQATLELLVDESYAELFHIDDESVEPLLKRLPALHERAAHEYQRDESDRIIRADLDTGLVHAFQESIQTTFAEDCNLRTALHTLSIAETDAPDEVEDHALTVLNVPRQKLVDVDAIDMPIPTQRFVRPITDAYTELVLENLSFETVSTETTEQLASRIRELIHSHPVRAILTTGRSVRSSLRDTDLYDPVVTPGTRAYDDQRGSIQDVPVLSLARETETVVVLFEGAPRVLEEGPADRPLALNVIDPADPSLHSDADTAAAVNRDDLPRHICVEVSYPAVFDATEQVGVILTLGEDSEG